MSDSAFCARLTYISPEDVAKLPGTMPEGWGGNISLEICSEQISIREVHTGLISFFEGDVQKTVQLEYILLRFHLVFTLHFEGYLPRRQKPAKYIKMIQGLADAVESQPFQMRSAAALSEGMGDRDPTTGATP